MAEIAEVASSADAGAASLLVLLPPVWRSRRRVMSRVIRCVIMMTIFMMNSIMRSLTILTTINWVILIVTMMCMVLLNRTIMSLS